MLQSGREGRDNLGGSGSNQDIFLTSLLGLAGETWRDAFRRKFPDLTEDDIDILISIINAHGWENDEGIEMCTDEFAYNLCERNDCDLIEWCTDQVFDSPA